MFKEGYIYLLASVVTMSMNHFIDNKLIRKIYQLKRKKQNTLLFPPKQRDPSTQTLARHHWWWFRSRSWDGHVMLPAAKAWCVLCVVFLSPPLWWESSHLFAKPNSSTFESCPWLQLYRFYTGSNIFREKKQCLEWYFPLMISVAFALAPATLSWII